MFADLVRKELREHLLALRLQMGFVLALALVGSSAFVLAAGYGQQRGEAAQAARAEDGFLRRYAHLNRVGGVVQARRPPAPLMLVRGCPRTREGRPSRSTPCASCSRPSTSPSWWASS